MRAYTLCMKAHHLKRVPFKTSVAGDTPIGLAKIAKREKLFDHGQISKGRAIDYLVRKELLEELETKDLLDPGEL
jgi:hypothetical protein